MNGNIVLLLLHLLQYTPTIQFTSYVRPVQISLTSTKFSSANKLVGLRDNLSNLDVSSENFNDKTIEELENDLTLIEAIEERNKAQIYSFIDEQDQWDSMDKSEQELLISKELVLRRLKELKFDE